MKMFVLFQLQKTKKFWGFFCGKFNQFDTDLNMMMVVWGNFVFANDIGRARVAWSASWSTTFNLIYVNCFKITLKGWTPYQTELFIKVQWVFCSIKTEAVVFSRKHSDRLTTVVDICGTKITTKEEMKVLGIIFDSCLTWNTHIRETLKKCNSKLGVLKKIRKRFTADQFLQIVTSQYYSQLYYCALVWLGDSTLSILKKRINSAHYRPLRIALKDYSYKHSRVDLSNICQRATPSEWYKYSIASLVIKTIANREPFYLYHYLAQTIYTTRRKPLIGLFYDNSKGKIGRQKINNKLVCMRTISKGWIDINYSKDSLRTMLKRSFFGYIKTKMTQA